MSELCVLVPAKGSTPVLVLEDGRDVAVYKRGNPGNPRQARRNLEIYLRYLAGETAGELAADYGLTRQRIHQIYRREAVLLGSWGKDAG